MKLDEKANDILVKGLFGVGFILLILFLFFFTGFFIQKNAPLDMDGDLINEFAVSGSMGDTINAVLTPLIGALAVLTTFLAFYVQFEANKQQRTDIRLERFENKFYEMLKLHRANVEEMEIDGRYKGRRVFLKMYQEFRFVYQVLKMKAKGTEYEKSSVWLTKTSYHYFFFGVFSNTTPITKESSPKRIQQDLIKVLQDIKDGYKEDKKSKVVEGQPVDQFPFKTTEAVGNNLELDFIPFGGHVMRLAHYYRHLYQVVKMACTDPALIKDSPKEEFDLRYQYVKLLRVQLSNHEQAMVYFNSFFVKGEIWWEEDSKKNYKNPCGKNISYFLDYAFIKNLPLNLTRDALIGPSSEYYFRERLRLRGYSEPEIENQMSWILEWIES